MAIVAGGGGRKLLVLATHWFIYYVIQIGHGGATMTGRGVGV